MHRLLMPQGMLGTSALSPAPQISRLPFKVHLQLSCAVIVIVELTRLCRWVKYSLINTKKGGGGAYSMKFDNWLGFRLHQDSPTCKFLALTLNQMSVSVIDNVVNKLTAVTHFYQDTWISHVVAIFEKINWG